MEKKKTLLKTSHEKPSVSVLQADELFVKKILSRSNSSIGDTTSHLSNFRTQAEVPFNWESQPGKPKDPPKDTDSCRSAALVDLPPQAAAASAAHAPPSGVSTKMADGGRFGKLNRVRQKMVVNKHVETAARGLDDYSNSGSKLDGNLDDHTCSSSPKSFCSSSSVGSASSSASNTTTSHNVALKPRSKLQKMALGCIKWVF